MFLNCIILHAEPLCQIMLSTIFQGQPSLLRHLVKSLPSLAHAMASSDEELVVIAKEEEENDCSREKQISVDPLSLKQTPRVLLSLVKPKFVSASLPCSATSSPEFSSSLPKSFKKWSNPAQLPHPAFHSSLARQQSIVQPKYQQHQQGMLLLRCKSCGDGRSSQPSEEFDILSKGHKIVTVQPQTGVLISESSSKVQEEMYATECGKEEEFKCGAMCLFLPGFAKKKQEQVQLRRQASREVKAVEEDVDDDDEEEEEEDAHDEEKEEGRSVASRVASLERFECASWSSAAILDEIEDDYEGGINAYFDLPLELIRGSTDGACSPVKTAFVFNRETKGGLKKSTSKSGPRKSCESSTRHVRFSTSTPVSFPPSPNSGCITPRLFQAREEFNAALLETQYAYINF